MTRKHSRTRVRRQRARGKPLGELLAKNPRVLRVLQQHGVNFCAGCFLTLTAPPEKVAAYHAVPDHEAFLRDLRKALKRS